MKDIVSFRTILFTYLLKLFGYISFLLISIFTTAQSQSIEGIINSYAQVDSLDICHNRLYFNTEQYGTFSIGDTILLIQMKGANIYDEINNEKFGKVRDYKDAGNHEINYISQINTEYIELKNVLLNKYSAKVEGLQIVRIPQYKDVTIIQKLKPLEWDGKIGGILIFFVSGTLSFLADIDASGAGFKGGKSNAVLPSIGQCNVDSFYYAENSSIAAEKGTSYANLKKSEKAGKGRRGSGGGGGQGFESGGGGGGNGGQGGSGGMQNSICGNLLMNGGIGGDSVPYSSLFNKYFMGSGGGGGQVTTKLDKNTGGSGGGIVIIQANKIEGNSKKIKCSGISGKSCDTDEVNCIEGQGGGGAAGSVMICSNNIESPLKIEIKGGDGSNVNDTDNELKGPGGGGGGGVMILGQNNIPINLGYDFSGGSGGTNVIENNPNRAENGTDGVIIFNQQIQKSFQQFYFDQKDAMISFTDTGCTDLAFNALEVDTMDTLVNYLWSFSDGNTVSGQNVVHTFPNPGNYSVKLSYSDLSSCSFYFDTFAIVKSYNLTMEPYKMKCEKTPIQVGLSTNSDSVNWSPGYLFSDSTNTNPFYQDVVSRYISASASFKGGCLLKDSMKIDVISPSIFSITDDQSICDGDSAILNVSGADTYLWSPAVSLSNTDKYSTTASPTQTTTYSVFLTNNTCLDTTTLRTTVLVQTAPIVKLKKSNDVNCTQTSALLTATGANSYTWLPANQYEAINFSTIRVLPFSSTIFQAIGTNLNGCTGKDSIEVLVGFSSYTFFLPNAFTPNNDGLNDYFRVKYIPSIKSFEFCIYNRYGQLIFKTNDYRQGWDGRYKSIYQPSGSYLYTLKAETSCGFIEKKDFVQLIR